MADAWMHAGYPIAWKHAEWKHDEVEPNWAGALAALRLKRSPAETRRAASFFEGMPLDEKIDPDMRVCQALHAYYLFRDDPDLTPPARRRLLDILRFKAAPRRIHPSIWKFGATENHAFMGHAWRLLVAQLDRNSAAAGEMGEHIGAFINEHIRKGWLEYNSPCYVEKEVGGLILVAEWAEDPLLRRTARLGLDILFAEHAALALEGMLGGPACRVYGPGSDGILAEEMNHNSRRDAACSGSYPMMWMLFGQGQPHPYGVLGAPLLATCGYVPPPAVVRLADPAGNRGRYEFKARRPGRSHQVFRRNPAALQPPPEAFDARVYAWVTPRFVLGSFQEVEGRFGASRSLPLTTILRVVGGTRRAVYTSLVPAHPPGRDNARVDCFQHQNVVLGRGAAGEAYLATREFERVAEQDGWIFLRTAEVFVAYRVAGCGYTWSGADPPSVYGDFIRFENPEAPFILEVAEAEDYGGNFDRFRADMADNRIELKPDGLSYESGAQGRAGPSAEPFVVTLRCGELPILDGSPVPLEDYGTFESPHLRSTWDSGIVTLRCGPERMTVNVTRPRAPVRIDETIAPLDLPYDSPLDKPDSAWAPFLNYWRLKPEQWAWNPASGMNGGCLRHDAGLGVEDRERGAHDAMMLLRGGESWTDYLFEADAFAAGGRFGLWVRADMQDEGGGNGRWIQGYMFVLDPRHAVCRLWRARKDGLAASAQAGSKPERNDFSNPMLLKAGSLPAASRYGRWMRLRFEAKGPALQCSVDGHEVLAIQDPVFPSGSVGFMAYKGHDVRFDNARVRRP